VETGEALRVGLCCYGRFYLFVEEKKTKKTIFFFLQKRKKQNREHPTEKMPVRTRYKKGQQQKTSSQRSRRVSKNTRRALNTRRGRTSPKRSRQSGRKRRPKTSSPRLVTLGYRENGISNDAKPVPVPIKNCLDTIRTSFDEDITEYMVGETLVEELKEFADTISDSEKMKTLQTRFWAEDYKAREQARKQEEEVQKKQKAKEEEDKANKVTEEREKRQQIYATEVLGDQTKTFTSFLKDLHSKLNEEFEDKENYEDTSAEAASRDLRMYVYSINYDLVHQFLNDLKEAFGSGTLSVEEITCNLLYKILGYKNLEIKEDNKTLKVVLNIKNKGRERNFKVPDEVIDITFLIQEIDNVMRNKEFTSFNWDDKIQSSFNTNIQNLQTKNMFTELLRKADKQFRIQYEENMLTKMNNMNRQNCLDEGGTDCYERFPINDTRTSVPPPPSSSQRGGGRGRAGST